MDQLRQKKAARKDSSETVADTARQPRTDAPATFVHVAPSGERQPFSDADNALIAGAQRRGESTVRISDVKLANGATLRFEVRFGQAAHSQRMPWGMSAFRAFVWVPSHASLYPHALRPLPRRNVICLSC